MNTTTPPVNNIQPVAKKKWCMHYFLGLCASILGAMIIEDSPEAAIGAGIAAILCCLVGCWQSKGKCRGIVFGVIAVIFGALDLADGLGGTFADGYDYMTGAYDFYNEEMSAVGLVIGAICLVVLLVLHFKGKKKEG